MNRIEAVREQFQGIDALIVDDPVDLYYLTSIDLSLGRLLITQTEAILFVDKRYFEQCKKHASLTVKLWDWKSPLPIPSKIHLGFDPDFTSYQSYLALTTLDVTLVAARGAVKKIRMIKDSAEIEKLAEASKLGSKGYDYVVQLLKEGVREDEIAIELELYWRKAGGERLAFSPIIAFGDNSAYPHYRAGKRELRQGDSVLIDIGVVFDHYHSDMTRMLFLSQVPREMEKIYAIVKEAQQRAFHLCRPGTTIGELDQAARQFIQDQGYELPHGLGHGVGLEVHEPPRVHKDGSDAALALQEGMVITIEPGIYLPGLGGVRLEDTIVITETGYESLTNRPLSKSLPVINI